MAMSAIAQTQNFHTSFIASMRRSISDYARYCLTSQSYKATSGQSAECLGSLFFGVCIATVLLSSSVACSSAPKQTDKPGPFPSRVGVNNNKLPRYHAADLKLAKTSNNDNSNIQLNDYSDINGTPIQLWVYRNPETKIIYRLRVTGHAPEEICLQASVQVFRFMEGTHATGYFSFGVADIVPAQQKDSEFHSKSEELVAAFENLMKTGSVSGGRGKGTHLIDKVMVYNIYEEKTSDTEFLSSPHPAKTRDRLAIAGSILPTKGPAFVPVRVWNDSGESTIFRFTIRPQDYGISKKTMKKLGGNASTSPIRELYNYYNRQHSRVSRAKSLKRKLAKSEESWSYASQQVSPANTKSISKANKKIASLVDRLTAWKGIEYLSLEFDRTLQGSLDGFATQQWLHRLQEYRKHNRQCRRALKRKQKCPYYIQIIPKERENPTNIPVNKVTMTDKLFVKAAGMFSASEYKRATARLSRKAEHWKEVLGKTKVRNAQGQSRVVDSLLRGWPMPASNQRMAATLDELLNEKMPYIWANILKKQKDKGINLLQDTAKVSGLLNRPNIFFRVKQASAGLFEVTPYYVITHQYIEIWDPIRNLIFVETPYSKN